MAAGKWSDLPARTRRLIVAAAVAEGVLKAAALIDMKRRPAGQIRGSKCSMSCTEWPVHKRAADGRLVLIDIFCMNGASLYSKILEDVTEVHRGIPRERMRYALEIPYVARESSAAEILALRTAWMSAGG